MGMSSPLILSISTVFALIGIVLVAIAFGTDNWSEFQVNRREIINAINANVTLKQQIQSDATSRPIYFSRTFGLFRECFPDTVPTGIGSYTSPLGTICINIQDYMLFGDTTATERFNSDQQTRMHLMRTTVAFYIIGLAFLFFCLFTGILGCWRRSPGLILSTGILLLFAVLFLAAAMAVWHGVDYLEREVLTVDPFYRSWQPILKQTTTLNYGWSYIVSWVGIGFVLIASLLMLGAYRAMKEEEADEYDKKHAPYMMPNYYDKTAMVPYAYGTYSGYGAYPAYYGGYGGSQYGGNGYYGYMTYGR